MGTLFVVATPIGNLEDISRRALRVLGEVSLIAAEDTRTTRHLLTAFGIKTPLTSFFEHSGKVKVTRLLEALDRGDVALVSEAGTPGVSDPGYALIVAAVEKGVPIVPIPGPSAAATALSISGLPADQYLFLGFLPRRQSDRLRTLREVARLSYTLVMYEAPHRLRASLEDLLAVLGPRPLVVCRELTKLHEEIFRGTPSDALEHFQSPRGEFTLVLAGSTGEEPGAAADAEAMLRELRSRGVGGKVAVAEVAAATGESRRKLYRLWLGL
ncbi:MAG: 16S rRNA (cytidine(1402)-2'-O)-methyltransferase [Chloroflexota bacterium]|nr:MAG: 16S rRNA (cytidine(1402)-2'-O)-methyltransferase [Chloroflexota bacterium]